MNAGDHDIAFRQKRIGIVQRPVRQNVTFRPGEHRDPLDARIHLPHVRQVLFQPLHRQPVGDRRALLMIGDRDVVFTRCP